MLKKREIRRITKGYYTIHEDPSLMVFCFKPSYLGLQNALSFHNLWEQETNPIILTTTKIKKSIREVFNRNVIIRRISSKYLFGFEYYKDGDFYFPYSDIEKTFIDMIYFKLYMDDELLKEFRARVDMKKLKGYLRAYDKKFQRRVLGVLG